MFFSRPYLLVLGFVVYQGLGLFKKSLDNDAASKVGIWFVVSCAANSLWLFTWLYEILWLSVILMLTLLYALIKIVLRTALAQKEYTFWSKLFERWPFTIYFGWITVALIANTAGFLKQQKWSALGMTDVFWAISLILIATALHLFLTWKKQLPEVAFVGAWALIAIAYANWQQEFSVSLIATGMGITLFFSSLINLAASKK